MRELPANRANTAPTSSATRTLPATRTLHSPNCQSPHGLGWLPGRSAVVSSIPIGQLRPKFLEGTMRSVRALTAAALLLLPACHVASAEEPKQGGILKFYHRDSPGSASIHEGATYSVNIPFMPVYNNLVVYNQHVAQNSIESIVPDLADSWAWSGDNKTLTFKLRQGVKWHDGKPFTSADVKCTFDMLMGKSQQKFRQNPRKSWYDQVEDVVTSGDYEASFKLKRPQPALLALLASGYTPVYPCHVSPGDLRTKPGR